MTGQQSNRKLITHLSHKPTFTNRKKPPNCYWRNKNCHLIIKIRGLVNIFETKLLKLSLLLALYVRFLVHKPRGTPGKIVRQFQPFSGKLHLYLHRKTKNFIYSPGQLHLWPSAVIVVLKWPIQCKCKMGGRCQCWVQNAFAQKRTFGHCIEQWK